MLYDKENRNSHKKVKFPHLCPKKYSLHILALSSRKDDCATKLPWMSCKINLVLHGHPIFNDPSETNPTLTHQSRHLCLPRHYYNQWWHIEHCIPSSHVSRYVVNHSYIGLVIVVILHLNVDIIKQVISHVSQAYNLPQASCWHSSPSLHCMLLVGSHVSPFSLISTVNKPSKNINALEYPHLRLLNDINYQQHLRPLLLRKCRL